MKRFRFITSAAAAACLLGAAVAAAPAASAGTAAPTAVAVAARPAAGTVRPDDPYPCSGNNPYSDEFNRCTTTSTYGSWVKGACNPGQNYNAANGPFNVYSEWNNCGYRVWIHQYVNWQNNGWSLCFSPGEAATLTGAYSHPMNIYISSTSSPCPN